MSSNPQIMTCRIVAESAGNFLKHFVKNRKIVENIL